jgi:hypothetical protein
MNWKSMEERSGGTIPALLAGTEGNHKNLRPGQPVSWLRSKL